MYNNDEVQKLIESMRFKIPDLTAYTPSITKMIDEVNGNSLPNFDAVLKASHMVTELTRPILAQTEALKRIMEKTLEPSRLLSEQLKSIQLQHTFAIETVFEDALKFQTILNSNKSVFEEIARTLSEFTKQYNIPENEIVPFLRRYKWFISPSMNPSFIFEIYKVAKMKGNQRGAVNKLFEDLLFGNNFEFLDSLLEEWRPRIDKNRYKIISDCFKIIKLSPKGINISNTILPTLIVQLDGILVDFLKTHTLKYGSYPERKKEFSTTLKSNSEIDSLANEVFLEVLFQHSRTDIPLENPFQFNRHKIIHGENKMYGRKDYLVRTIFIIDYLASLK